MADMFLAIVLRAVHADRVFALAGRYLYRLLAKAPGDLRLREYVAQMARHGSEVCALLATVLEYRAAGDADAQTRIKAAEYVLDAWADGNPTPRDREQALFPASKGRMT